MDRLLTFSYQLHRCRWGEQFLKSKCPMPSLMADARNQNEWTAVFLAAAELSRRGYSVALTLGPNAPLADLVVRSPQGENFIVDVKGKGRSGRWCVKPKVPTPNLFYILVRLRA